MVMRFKIITGILFLSIFANCTPATRDAGKIPKEEKEFRETKREEIKLLDTLPLFDTKKDLFVKKTGHLDAQYKLVTYIDGSCFTCAKDFVLWKDFIRSLKNPDSVEFIFFFHTDNLDMFKPYFKRWRFFRNIYVDKMDTFKNVNSISDDKSKQTYLLDKDNKVLEVGNPIYSENIKEKYTSIFNDNSN